MELAGPLGQQHPVPPLVRPSGVIAYLVIPPAPQHGFVVDTDNLQQASPHISWVQHLNSFILSTRNLEAMQLLFTSTTTKERFYLLLSKPGGRVYSGIENEAHSAVYLKSLYSFIQYGTADENYNRVIGKGKSVFVTQRECMDKSVADFIITLSM